MKKKIGLLFIICLFSVGIIVLLFLVSENLNQYSNSFKRLFVPHAQKKNNQYELNAVTWYVCGIDDSRVLFSNNRYWNISASFNFSESDTNLRFLNLPQIQLKNPKMSIRNNIFYILDGELPGIYKASTSNLSKLQLINNHNYFDIGVPVDTSTIVIRQVDKDRNFILTRIDDKNHKQVLHLTKGSNNLMANDGMLLFDEVSKKIVYVYYYRNQFVVADSNLMLLYKGKTRDTVSQAKIKVGKPGKDGDIIMSAPPLVTNRTCAVYNDLLFINSALIADNERKDLFKISSVIDVYNLRNGNYKFSFYIPDDKKQKIKEFKIYKNWMIVQFKNHCITYKLTEKYFK